MSALISAGIASQRRGDKVEESPLGERCCGRVLCSQRNRGKEHSGRRSPSPVQSPDEAGASTAPGVSRGGPILPGGNGGGAAGVRSSSAGSEGRRRSGSSPPAGHEHPAEAAALSPASRGTALLPRAALGGFMVIGDAPCPRLSWSLTVVFKEGHLLG